ncbi:hypothetical protein PVT71_12985 [Salipiger sp. H15]|uniref:Uncharacterized protein n=1 Tax=Alloyangia sp. H15 TaxID=3029062 RepID=A0AAU8AG11_9RHOB
MQTLHDGYRGLGLLLAINWDRLFFVTVILTALYFGAFLGTL